MKLNNKMKTIFYRSNFNVNKVIFKKLIPLLSLLFVIFFFIQCEKIKVDKLQTNYIQIDDNKYEIKVKSINYRLNSSNYYGHNPQEAARIVLSDNDTGSYYDLDGYHFELILGTETYLAGNGLMPGEYQVCDCLFYPDYSKSGAGYTGGILNLILPSSSKKKNRDYDEDYDFHYLKSGKLIITTDYEYQFDFMTKDGIHVSGKVKL